LAKRGSNTVGSRIAATDDDDLLAFGVDWFIGFGQKILRRTVKVFHCEMDAFHGSTRDLQIAWLSRTDAKDDCVEI